MNFFVFSLPRSRSAWVSNLLTWGNSFCHHELLADVSSLDEYRKEMARRGYDYMGNCGSDNLLQADWIFHNFPDARFAFLKRDPLKIRASCEKLGIECVNEVFEMGLNAEMRVRMHEGIVIDVDNWSNEDTLRLWNHVIPNEPFPYYRNLKLNQLNVQITGERWEHLFTRAAA